MRKREARGGEQFFTFVCRGERCLSGKKQSDNLTGEAFASSIARSRVLDYRMSGIFHSFGKSCIVE